MIPKYIYNSETKSFAIERDYDIMDQHEIKNRHNIDDSIAKDPKSHLKRSKRLGRYMVGYQIAKRRIDQEQEDRRYRNNYYRSGYNRLQ